MANALAETPEWLNEQFLLDGLKKDPESANCVAIKDLESRYLVAKGENFCSTVLRVTFRQVCRSSKGDTVEKPRQLVVKILFSEGEIAKILTILSQFSKEEDTYNRLMPEFYSILENAGLQKKFTCRCLLTNKALNAVFLEDLSLRGYKVRDKRLGMDLQHTKLVLEILAMMHAASMQYYHKNSTKTMPEYYNTGFLRSFAGAGDIIEGFMGKPGVMAKVKAFAESLRGDPRYGKHVAFFNKLLGGQAFEEMCRCYVAKPGNIFNAHLHGDCWNNNFLFRYDQEGKPMDVMTVDLQVGFYGSVANDFLAALATCCDRDVSTKYFKEVSSFYHGKLCNTLNQIGYQGQIPTLQQFKEELMNNILVVVTNLVVNLAVVMTPDSEEHSKGEETQHLESIIDDVATKPNALLEKQRTILTWLDTEGFIDHYMSQ